MRAYVCETLVTPNAVLVIDETGFLNSLKEICNACPYRENRGGRDKP